MLQRLNVVTIIVVTILIISIVTTFRPAQLEQVLCASLAGVVERVNKLISVTPVKTRFFVKLFEIIILTSNVQGTMVKLAM